MDMMHQHQQLMVAPAKRGRKPKEGKQKRKRRPKPTDHIKKPKTGYFYYLEAFRKNFGKNGEQIPRASEITKACGAKWTSMNEAEKKPYADLALTDRERYLAQREMFTKKRDPDKPKKPATAYFLFLEDFRKKMKGVPLEPGKRLTVICGEEWNKLTDQQKKPYQDQVAIKYQLYEEAMKEWRLKGIPEPHKAPTQPSQSSMSHMQAASMQQQAQHQQVQQQAAAVQQHRQQQQQQYGQVGLGMANSYNGSAQAAAAHQQLQLQRMHMQQQQQQQQHHHPTAAPTHPDDDDDDEYDDEDDDDLEYGEDE
ncbi:intrastrand cross-link recognition protein-like isoform X2 [Patiria miniata]|uniref:HMG box domain-containing protein n=1 Tax=Patiria miniata TaxID=46514 RepID=A0A914AUD7_PATMI|nr:intrastrand cross-link recognition protein-like isoform X2 [Patiria miniata]